MNIKWLYGFFNFIFLNFKNGRTTIRSFKNWKLFFYLTNSIIAEESCLINLNSIEIKVLYINTLNQNYTYWPSHLLHFQVPTPTHPRKFISQIFHTNTIKYNTSQLNVLLARDTANNAKIKSSLKCLLVIYIESISIIYFLNLFNLK